MATVTLATLIQRARRWLMDEPWETTLSGSISAGYASFTVPDGTQWSEGSLAEFPDGDVARVSSVSGNTLTAKGGHNDSTSTGTGTAHTAGDVILKDPEFEYKQIEEAISRAVETLWPYGYDVKTDTLTPVAATYRYNLASDFMAMIAAVQLRSGLAAGAKNAYVHYGRKGSGYYLRIIRNLPTGDFASGIAAELTPNNTDNSITYTYAAEVTTSTVDDGLMADFVVMDACRRLLEMKETERVGSEDVDHGTVGVGPGARLRDAAWFDQQAKEARHELTLYLKKTNPLMPIWRG